jgi:hypothetical protein
MDSYNSGGSSMGVSSRMQHINDYEAVEQSDGSWLHNDGDVYWHNADGQIHREDGPAIIHDDGEVEWYLNDEEYTLEDWLKLSTIPDEAKMMLRLQYG